jgi:hypothetical protein
MAAPIGIDIRGRKLVFNHRIGYFKGFWGKNKFGGKSRQVFEELLIVGLHNFSFEN